jgi:hypothetical protein
MFVDFIVITRVVPSPFSSCNPRHKARASVSDPNNVYTRSANMLRDADAATT